jgi:hypothetical protein
MKKIMRDVVSDEGSAKSSILDEKPNFLSKEKRQQTRQGSDFRKLDELTKTRKKRGWLKWFIGVIVLVIIFLLLSSVFAQATINIIPRSETVELDNSLVVHLEDEGELTFKVMALETTESSKIESTGSKFIERKASGVITVYNDHGREGLRLVQNTRFKSPDGKIYRINKALFVPGQRIEDGETVPGSVEATVYADEPGEEYNIGPTRFSVPGFAGTAREKTFYAQSSEAIRGGFAGEVKIVSDDDLASAREDLQGELSVKLQEMAKTQVPDDYVFFPDAFRLEFSYNEYDDSTQTENDFTVLETGTLHGVIFSIEEISRYLANEELPSAEGARIEIDNFQDLSLEIDDYDEIGKSDSLSIHLLGPARFVWQYDAGQVKNDLAGVKKSEYQKVFANHPAIDKAEVSIRPFWKRTFPKNVEKIEIKD